MTAQIIDGKAIATHIRNVLKLNIEQRLNEGLRAPGLAVVQVGKDPASEVYVRNKRQACAQTGILSFAYDLPEETSQTQLLNLIDELNSDSHVDGILVQLPLPPQINPHAVIDHIHPDKDVDGFHPYNLGRLAQRRPLLRPCTPYGIMMLLEHIGIAIKGMDAVVVGASNIVGRPMSLELLMAGCTVTICHSATRNLSAKVASADLLVVAIGKLEVVASEWIKPGAIVIDVGMHRKPNGSLAGDIDFTTAKERAAWITPVPGGVGPMTIATLLQNTVFAANKLHKAS